MNAGLQNLQPYPFAKLNALLNGVSANQDFEHISFGIGEPMHKTPDFILQEMNKYSYKIQHYPAISGLAELRQALKNWLENRFKLQHLDTNQVLPVAGTREGLFSIVQLLFDKNQSEKNLVAMPNPFYQIYEGATLLAGGKPFYLPMDENFNPNYKQVSSDIWQQLQILFVCSPNNPTGKIASFEDYKYLLELSEEHNFVLISDECYSEIYRENAQAPLGLLEACEKYGKIDYKNALVFNSLSKRSSAPGLRSGLVAGDADLIKNFALYRTYHGASLAEHTQLASILAWQDEDHVKENRNLYDKKMQIFSDIIGVEIPQAGFYIWLDLQEKGKNLGKDAALELWRDYNLTVLPGEFLAREVEGKNPAENHLRIALVSELETCELGAKRLKTYLDK